ncbi:MAG: hypothetical protein KC466_15295 [Myxococcales bacterium]|nr:hypothetical protein [Myxococcales bacterium]
MKSTLTKPRRCRRCGTVTVMQGAKTCSNCLASLAWSETLNVEDATREPAQAQAWRDEKRTEAAAAPTGARGGLFDRLREIGEQVERAEQAARRREAEGGEGGAESPDDARSAEWEPTDREELRRSQTEETTGTRPRRRSSPLRWIIWALIIGAALVQNVATPERIREIKEWLTGREEPAATTPSEPSGSEEAAAVGEARGALHLLAKTIDLHAMRTGAPPKNEAAWRRTFEYQLAYDRVAKHFAEGTRPTYEILRETREGRWYRLTAVARDPAGTVVTVEGVARVRAGRPF